MPPPPVADTGRRRGSPVPLAAFIVAFAAVACSDGPEPEVHAPTPPRAAGPAGPDPPVVDGPTRDGAEASVAVEDLTRRAPDVRAVDVAEHRPTEARGWGPLALGGWKAAGERTGERVAVRSSGGAARLSIPASTPEARRLTIDARLANETAEDLARARLELSLNGVALGAVDASREWATASVDAPRPLWSRGANRLDLSLVDTGGDPVEGAFDLSSLGVLPAEGPATGLEALPDPTDAGITSGGAIVYRVAAVDGARLTAGGRSEVAGGVWFEVFGLDPADETRLERVASGFEDVEEAFDFELALPPRAPAVCEIEVRWEASDGCAVLDLGRLELARRLAERAPPPLVLFVSVDTLSAHHMGLYGYERPTTPRLEALAESDLVVFEHCHANASWTVPSYTSQLTGLFANANRVPHEQSRSRTVADQLQVAPNRLTLAEVMRAAGYRTAAIVDNPWLASTVGIAQGFEHFDSEPSEYPLFKPQFGARMVFRRGLELIERDDDPRPLFLMLQVLDVHGPYITVPPWEDTFAEGEPESWTYAPVDACTSSVHGIVPKYVAIPTLGLKGQDPEEVPVEPIRDAYDEKILEIDTRLADLIESLRDLGQLDDALVVISADHGESTLAREFYFRHADAYGPTLDVPLLVRLPGGRDAGRQVSERVQLVDLMPTLVEAAGVEPDRLALHGASLFEVLEGQREAPRPVYASATYLGQSAVLHGRWKLVEWRPWKDGSAGSQLTNPRLWAALVEDRPAWAEELAGGAPGATPPWDLTRRWETFVERHRKVGRELKEWLHARGPVVELFDLETDPRETRDVSDEHPEVVERLSWALKYGELLDHQAAERADFVAEPPSLSSAEEERLRALGYLADEGGD